MQTSITIALATITLATAPIAVAAQNAPAAEGGAPRASTAGGAGGHGKGEFLESYDTNADGRVSREEFSARRAQDHKSLDLSGNGAVSELEYVTEYTWRLDRELAERRVRQIRQAHVRFNVLDTNKDGILSAEEFKASGDRMFSRLDTNADGNVDAKDTARSY